MARYRIEIELSDRYFPRFTGTSEMDAAWERFKETDSDGDYDSLMEAATRAIGHDVSFWACSVERVED